MVGYICTKPLQGKLFRQFRNWILNIHKWFAHLIYDPKQSDTSVTLHECVENNVRRVSSKSNMFVPSTYADIVRRNGGKTQENKRTV